MKKFRRILAALLLVTLLAGTYSVALAAEKTCSFKFKIEQETLAGETTVYKTFALASKANSVSVTVKITSNVTGEEEDVDIYRMKYEVLNPAGKRIGKQVALDALEGRTTSIQNFTDVAAGDLKVKIISGAPAANLIYTVTVSGEYAVTLNKTAAVVKKGSTLQLTSEYAGGMTKSWTSSNEDVAVVNDSGLVTAVGPGNANIYLTAGETQTVKCAITVYGLEPIAKGDYYPKSTYQMKLLGASSKDTITWTSSDTSVATVTSKGKVKAVGIGKTKITAKVTSNVDGKTRTYSATFKVKKNPFPKTMYVSGTKNLALRDAPSKDTGKLIKYIPKGTAITVTAINGDWATVKVDGKKYYMMKKYLSDKK